MKDLLVLQLLGSIRKGSGKRVFSSAF